MSDRTETAARETDNESPRDMERFAGKYLTFVLNEEYYGLEILKVRELICIQKITRVPDTKPYLKGAINLRGQVIAVIDLRLKFGIPEKPYTEETCIIIVDMGNTSTGMIVDKVDEVIDLQGKDIEPPPRFQKSVESEFIRAMGKTSEKILILLDTQEILSAENKTL